MGPPRSGGVWGGRPPGVSRARLQAQRGQVQGIAVGELAQALEVELAEEGQFGRCQRGLAEVDHRRRRGLVVRDAREQEHQPRRRPGRLGVPARSGRQRDPFGELAPVQLVPAAQHPPLGVDIERYVPERASAHAWLWHRTPSFGHSCHIHGYLTGVAKAGDEGEAAAGAGGAVTEEVAGAGGGGGVGVVGVGPVGRVVVWIWGAGTPASTRAWRLAAHRSRSQRSGPEPGGATGRASGCATGRASGRAHPGARRGG